MHDRIADEDGIQDVAALHVAFGADLVDQAGNRLAHGDRHAFAAVRVHHDVGDAAHQILAEADLRVRRTGGGRDAAGQQRNQMHGDRGRADVAGEPIGLVLEARPQRDDARYVAVGVLVDRGGGGPVALAQYALHLRHEVEIEFEVLEAPVLHQGDLEPVEVAERLVHVGLFDLDVAHADRRIAGDDPGVGILADGLGVDDRVLRHVDDEVAEDLRRAGEAAPFRQAAHALVAFFLGPLGRDVVVRGNDLVLGEVAFLHLDLAAPAGGAAAAHAFDIDAELARSVEHGRADGEAPALAGRHEQDEGIGDVGRRVHACKDLDGN